MKLSIVATLYRSSKFIEEFHRRASIAAREFAGDSYEIILVNDGSPDDSVEVASALTEEDSHVTVVDLSRNFGHHKAMMAGLMHSVGDLVFLIDTDLEEHPEWLAEFAKAMVESNADVVYGQQIQRKGNFFEIWSGSLYYSIFNWLANIDHPRNIVTARLMSQRYVQALLQHRERELVISCLWVITGFKQIAKSVEKRAKGSSTYNISRKLDHAINAVTSFSELPLKIIFYLGFFLFFSSLVYAGWLAFTRIFLRTPLDGWTSVMVSIWVLGGLIISFIGIIGIYLSKIFSETKQRPFVIVRGVYGKNRTTPRVF
ncbi:glycosyltransferase family 2 protein [soil metagenome]